MTMGIYGLYSPHTDKWYIGASIDIEKRITQHTKELRKAVKCNHRKNLFHSMGNVAKEFGILSIQWCIIEEVYSTQELTPRELYWVKEKQSLTNGYNCQRPTEHRLWKNERGNNDGHTV